MLWHYEFSCRRISGCKRKYFKISSKLIEERIKVKGERIIAVLSKMI